MTVYMYIVLYIDIQVGKAKERKPQNGLNSGTCNSMSIDKGLGKSFP